MSYPAIGANFGLTRNEVFELSEELSNEFGHWNEHPNFPLADWQHEVANDYTRYGYWAWVAKQTAEERQA